MNAGTAYINIANLPLDENGKLQLSTEENGVLKVEEQGIQTINTLRVLQDILEQQKITNLYLQEILGDKIDG